MKRTAQSSPPSRAWVAAAVTGGTAAKGAAWVDPAPVSAWVGRWGCYLGGQRQGGRLRGQRGGRTEGCRWGGRGGSHHLGGDRRRHADSLRPLLGHGGGHADPLPAALLGKDVTGQGAKAGPQSLIAGSLAPDLGHHQGRVIPDLEVTLLGDDPIGGGLDVLHIEDEHRHGRQAEQDQAAKHHQGDLHGEHLGVMPKREEPGPRRGPGPGGKGKRPALAKPVSVRKPCEPGARRTRHPGPRRSGRRLAGPRYPD
jgi:hypothetical protein